MNNEKTSVDLTTKKQFIRDFLNNYQLKRRESTWILNYILSNNEALKNVHFVEQVQYCPRGITISTHCSKDIPFRFYKKGIMTTNPEKAFHDIRLDPGEPMYIELRFTGDTELGYLNLLEDNPWLPPELISEKYEEVEQLVNHVTNTVKLKHLMEQIDEALSNNDKKQFLHLTKEYNKILGEM